jgi:large subunit ribosomal protein L22
MNEAKAQLNDYRQSPRKVRIVADTVRGKSVEEALNILTFIPKRAGLPLKKLIASAYANSGKAEGLVVKEIKVDTGPTLYRRRPRSRGMADPIRKRTSHISIVLSESKVRTKPLAPRT